MRRLLSVLLLPLAMLATLILPGCNDSRLKLPLTGVAARAAGSVSPVATQRRPVERVERPSANPKKAEDPQSIDIDGTGDEDGDATPGPASGFDDGALEFFLKFQDMVSPYAVLGLFVMPGETVELETVFTEARFKYAFTAAAGDVDSLADNSWRWTAPQEPGHYALEVFNRSTGATMHLNAFVQVPYDHAGTNLDGYRIGQYQAEPLRGNPKYERPEGFIKITEENKDVLVSPHFKLGQFQSKQGGDTLPKYALINQALLLKLEMILQAVNEEGIEANTLHVMSGFRTPHYNRAIGNKTVYSRHLYGDAADIFVDVDKDGSLDDLNGDGDVTRADAAFLAAIVEEQSQESWYRPFVGGLGIYGPAPHRGPFIHVDTRGSRARW